jgi:plasmid stabilization system protein ParE
MAYRITPQAQREREGALEYSAVEWGLAAAQEFARAMDVIFDQIGGWSPPGSVREQWADRRFLWVRLGRFPYFIVWSYGEDRDDRVIVRILHTHRDLGPLMSRTEPWS